MTQKDENGLETKTIRVDLDTYKKIELLARKEEITRGKCLYYMTRFFHESERSVRPGNHIGDLPLITRLEQQNTQNTDRIIRLLRLMEKEYFRSTITRLTTIEGETSESVSYLEALSKEFDRGLFSKSEEKYNLKQNADLANVSGSPESLVNSSSQAELLERIGELEILEEKARIRMEGAIELLERIISPDHCTMLDEGEFAPRVHKFRRADVEEIKGYILQCM